MSDKPRYTPLFDAETHKAASRTVPGMAHWVDINRTDNARCRTCAHFVQAKTRTAKGELRDGQCRKWRDLIDPRARGRSWPKISYRTRACKYHEQSANPPEAFVRVSTHG